jgi:hypothetical protein
VILTSRRPDSFLYEAAQNFESLFKYSKLILKNQKPLAVKVLFKAYPVVPLSNADPICRTVPFNGRGRGRRGGVSRWPKKGGLNQAGLKRRVKKAG